MSDKHWGLIKINYPGTAFLAHTQLYNGGSDIPGYGGASIVAYADKTYPVKPILKVDHVTVKDSVGYGILLDRVAGFIDGSTDLTITGSGKSDTDHPHPIQIDFHALSSLPPGSYTGNALDAIRVDNYGTPLAYINYDITIHERGVPYHLHSGTYPISNVSAGDPVPTLTIESGVEMKFDADGVILVGGGIEGQYGALKVNGTDQNPVVLTSADEFPAPGDWIGIVFRSGPGSASNMIQHARIEYAGGDSGFSGWSCNGGADDGGVIIAGWIPFSSFVNSTEILYSKLHGVIRGWEGPTLVDFTGSNSFLVQDCEQTNPRYPGCEKCTMSP